MIEYVCVEFPLAILLGGFLLGVIAGMYIHYYHGESLASDGDKI